MIVISSRVSYAASTWITLVSTTVDGFKKYEMSVFLKGNELARKPLSRLTFDSNSMILVLRHNIIYGSEVG